MEPMWFFDESEDLASWQEFRKQAEEIEEKHLAARKALADAEAALRANPADRQLTARVEELKKQLAELERQAPWISFDYPMEVLLWGVPHG
jgi:polyhydroxyalkanoate synthesis regulator phasin